ncbi:hypothetical protein ABEB36_005747 [Hypothenemus hampei]|uniref:Ubinuclein-1 n=1 Tax=Hypothenemus hampei TaxID=57062 RepID=A0ABD1EZE1_HYPHA
MSDIKRAVLTTLEPQKANEKTLKKHSKTVRIRLALPESNEDKCPEYNYKDELAAAKKKLKQIGKDAVNNVTNGLDPFGDENDDDVRRIALEMEAKYGTGMTTSSSKKKRKGRKDDYADIGAGYDESDSFIDNTDGYDEIIPHNVTTVRGGFYINSGALEFKTDDEASSEVSSSSSGDSDSDHEQSPNKSKRKRPLESSDEEGGGDSNDESGQEQKKENGEKPNISMQQAIKKKLFSANKIQNKRPKVSDHHKNTIKELLREKRSDINNGTDTSRDLSKENKKPMKLSSVEDAIDSVINRIEQGTKTSVNVEAHPELQISDPNRNGNVLFHFQSQIFTFIVGESTLTSNIKGPSINSEAVNVDIVKLPENLPEDILQIIEKIKLAAKDYKDGGKVKFFNKDVNLLLLNLERKCKVLGRSSRVKVYEHLAQFVKCRKETLIKRSKNLVYEEDARKLQKTIENLKNQIMQLLPALITNHEKECQRILQRKFSLEAVNNEELKNLKAPRRKFPLHEEMKRMIRDIISFKKRCLLHEGKAKNDLESLLTEYLKRDILTLWPEGWMSMTVLKKYCTLVAIKTPDPKNALNKTVVNKPPSQKLPVSSTIINYNSGNSLTIKPINLTEKISEVCNNVLNISDTTIEPLLKSTESIIKSSIERIPEKIVKHKEVLDILPTPKDNGVIVLSPKLKGTVITQDSHCPVIDLTDTPIKSEENCRPAKLSKDPSPSNDFTIPLKAKYPALSVTASNSQTTQNDTEEVLKVIESLKALQKMSTPVKSETTNPAVSVIAFNKNYSNSNSGHSSGLNNERTSFSGSIGFQDEFQRQFVNSLNHKPSQSSPPKTGYNKCS